MNELITMNKLNVTAPTFKDERLNKATERITAIYTDALKFADTKNREISKILADVMAKKAYELDGFKSVAEYANMTFGINRQNAYALATAGKVYNDKKAPDALKAFSPSKLAELAKVDSKAIEKALNEGKINPDTTQKELREFAASATNKATAKPKVVDTFTVGIVACNLSTDDWSDHFSDDCHLTIGEWQDAIKDLLVVIAEEGTRADVELIKLPNGHALPDSKKATVKRDLYLYHGLSVVVEYRVYIQPKSEPPKKPRFTKAELLEMLAQMEEDEKKGK